MKQRQGDKWEGLAVVLKNTTHKVPHKEPSMKEFTVSVSYMR